MMAGPATDPTALSWCLAEIRESLARAETALEQQLQSDEAADGRLRAARGWLHQAHGALQVVDLEGVSVVTQEAEALLDRCDRGELPFDAGLVRAMARAFSAVVEYLEGVVAGSEDSPVSLFPHYRELLAMRGAERVEPSDLFTADLTVRAPRVPQGEPLSARAVARLRAAFEQGLLRFLRNPRDAEALGAMHGAVSRLHAAHGASGQRTFWWLSRAFLDALRVQALPVDVYAKRLVGRINLQLSRTLGGGAPIADRLLRDLLFMLARTGSGSPLADEARRLYRLTGTVPSDFETPRYAVVDARTLRAARDATTAAKLGWEKYVRGGSQELPAFAQAAQQLDAAVARLPWPGLQKLSGVFVGLRRALAAAGSSLAEVLSLEVATALLFVEQALERGARAIAQHDRRASEMAERLDRLCERQEGDGQAAPEWLTELSRAAQERLTTAAYVGELQANLRACEKVLDAFFRDPAAHRAELPPLGPLLRQVAGALRLLGHDEAADGADTVLRQVAAFAASGPTSGFGGLSLVGDDAEPDEAGGLGELAEAAAPLQADCERVAASLGAIGFFVESLRQADRRRGGGFEFSRDDDAFVARLGDRPGAHDASDLEPPEGDAHAFADPSDLEPPAALSLEPPAAFVAEAPAPDAAAFDANAFAFDGALPGADVPDGAGSDGSALSGLEWPAGGDGVGHPPSGSDAAVSAPADGGFAMDWVERQAAGAEVDRVDATPSDIGFIDVDTDADADRSLETLLLERRAQVTPLLAALAAAPADPMPRAALHDTLRSIRDEAMLLDDGELRMAAADALARLDAGDPPDAPALVGAVARVAGLPDGPVIAPVVLPAEDAIDAELLGIFFDEADEVLAGILEARLESIAAPADAGPLTTLRRGFHTLKGSSRMVGLTAFGEAAWSIEEVISGWVGDERAGTPPLYALVADAHDAMVGWVARLRDDPLAAIDPASLIARAHALRDGEVPDVEVRTEGLPPVLRESLLPAGGRPAAAVSATATATATEAPALPELQAPAAIEGLASFDLEALDEAVRADGGYDAPADAIPGLDASQRHTAFPPVQDDLGIDLGLDADTVPFDAAPSAPPMLLDEIVRVDEDAFAPIGAAGDDELIELTEVFDPLDALDPLDPLDAEVPTLSPLDEIDPLAIGGPAGPDVFDALHALDVPEAPELPELPELSEPTARDTESVDGMVRIGDRLLNAQLFRIFLDEAGQLLSALDAAVAGWRLEPTRAVPEPALRAMHSLRGTARIAGLPSVLDTADALERGLSGLAARRATPSADDLDDLAWIAARLRDTLATFSNRSDPAPDPQMVALAEAFAVRACAAAPAPERTGDDAFDLADVDAALGVPEDEPQPAPAAPVVPAAARAVTDASLESIATLADDIDAELAQDFVEEGDELLPRIGDALRAWAAAPDDPSHPAELMRLLHTVKGSARMAGAMRLGHLVHDMETRIESASALTRVPPQLIDELIARLDQVLALYEAVRDPKSESAQAAARAVFASLAPRGAGLEGGPDASGAPTQAQSDDGVGARATAPGAAGQQPSLIRVRADLLDRLVNEAGEVSIARARLENELGSLRTSLGELTENVNRLRTQLREIELAADSQIDARNERSPEREAQFDPLEFDRYTRFQELTRMLAESVNDVATVQQNALRNLDEANRDLARQTQVTRDLQQDLMRIRMVQFGSIADRLYRVVRQAAKELDKRVHLDLKGVASELDRGVLERMAGPIEHLLRNAVAHGIESRSDRLAAGKSETGEITLEVRQEGNEVVLAFADDGAGLNYARIRARAVERGLIAPDAHPGERELGDMIFMPGFSTATEVTAIAGRGVGMDVVRAEVAAMGGRIDLESTPGRGTRFSVHLPVSLAVAQVVLLTVGSMRIAVTSALIEQVMQLKPDLLASAYSDHAVDWHGQPVPLYFLGSLLELSGCTPLAQRYSPVVIVRSGAQRIALHVDHVAPSQEVVVKHVGPQLARLTGMAGATVLGNGDIVLILNPVQIAATGRGAQAGEGDTASFAPTVIEIAPTVMVVDDSVTVRKVTQRLLAREGYQVMLAKDGIDALRQLQDTVPDVMLLDIEMPRMDGFDLTTNLRGDDRWKHLPIVMITSRTADKHRSHALSLGVDAFLGKPYDEDELLQLVAAFARRRQSAG
jgi:chemosensory pili system protein ChpA (sensor histidine kinase/response regulator)